MYTFLTLKGLANMKRERKNFSRRVTPLFETMMVQALEELEPITDEAANEEHVPVHSNDPSTQITKLKERVRKLKRMNKSRTPGLKWLRKVGRSAQVVSSKDEGVFDEQEVKVEKVVSTAEVTTAIATTTTADELTLAQTLIEINSSKPKGCYQLSYNNN
ncbi:hypothetical protein Tco_0785596 [Tanacetum coccineum]